MISISPSGATWSRAEAINDSGWAVGSFRIGQGNRAFIYDGAPSRDVGLLPGTSELWLRDINNSGTAVGYAPIDASHAVAVKYQGGVLVDLATHTDLAIGSRQQRDPPGRRGGQLLVRIASRRFLSKPTTNSGSALSYSISVTGTPIWPVRSTKRRASSSSSST